MDWTGNKKTTFSTLGASSHSEHEREINDYYATDPIAIKPLIERVKLTQTIWECACGEGHLSRELEVFGYTVISTDIINRGYGSVLDFLKVKEIKPIDYDIVTNPPYKFAKQFIEKALEISREGGKVCMFLKLTFLEGQARYNLFKQNPPKYVYVFSRRIRCGLNGTFKGSSAVCFSWFVWEKGNKDKPTIDWII